MAINAADLSSGITLQWMSGWRIKAREIGAQRDPGESMASVMPLLAQIEAR